MRKRNAIKSFRLKLLWDQVKLAKELGVTRSAVSNWEQGIRYPGLSALVKIKDIALQNNISFNQDDFIAKG